MKHNHCLYMMYNFVGEWVTFTHSIPTENARIIASQAKAEDKEPSCAKV